MIAERVLLRGHPGRACQEAGEFRRGQCGGKGSAPIALGPSGVRMFHGCRAMNDPIIAAGPNEGSTMVLGDRIDVSSVVLFSLLLFLTHTVVRRPARISAGSRSA